MRDHLHTDHVSRVSGFTRIIDIIASSHYLKPNIISKLVANLGWTSHGVTSSCMCAQKFVLPFSKCIVAPTAAMVDSRSPVRLQMQPTGEEESDELEDLVA